jgi:cysteine-rich repeat protein
LTTPQTCTPVCGNVKNGNEACDDGFTVSGDGCSSSCTIETGFQCSGAIGAASVCTPICGDGKKQTSESCDDGGISQGSFGTGCLNCVEQSNWNCVGGTSSLPDICSPICGNVR